MIYCGDIKYLLGWTLFVYTFYLTSGSSGDRSEPFQRCLKHCFSRCKNVYSYPGRLPVYLVVFGWQCSDECKYSCMHNITERAIARGWKIEQYYGKVGNKNTFF